MRVKKREDFKIKEIEHVAKEKNIDLNIYHAERRYIQKLGLKQNSLTFCFLSSMGSEKETRFYRSLRRCIFVSKVATFVQSVQQEYLK
ncbi:hypothetical protein RCO48_11505 [Peribacillus frigoritolerans]|nr:hypothetical protein [Peribacillus frigoritolerans]